MQGQRCQPSAVSGRPTRAAATLFFGVLKISSLTFGLGTNPYPLQASQHIGSNKLYKLPVSWSLSSGKAPGDSGISRCCSGEEPPMTKGSSEEMYLCCLQNRMFRNKTETYWETREEVTLGLLKKKRNPYQRNKISDSTVRSVNFTDFYRYFRFSSPHISVY